MSSNCHRIRWNLCQNQAILTMNPKYGKEPTIRGKLVSRRSYRLDRTGSDRTRSDLKKKTGPKPDQTVRRTLIRIKSDMENVFLFTNGCLFFEEYLKLTFFLLIGGWCGANHLIALSSRDCNR